MRRPDPLPPISTTLDDFNAAGLAKAIAFTATIRAAGRSHTCCFETVEEAQDMARKMTAAVSNSRRAMVYAITAEGASFYHSTP